jgi:hypothetical protein
VIVDSSSASTPKSLLDLLCDLSKTNKQNKIQDTRGENSGWTEQGMKEIQRDIDVASKQSSTKYLPTNLPSFKFVVLEDSPPPNIIPVTSSIKTPQLTNFVFKKTRILVTMIKLLQILFQESYIDPSNTDNTTTTKIAHRTQIPKSNNEVLKYMYTPKCTNGVWSTKIYIHSNKKLKDFVSNDEFQNYIVREQLMIKYNKLNTIIPMNIGFLEQMVPNRESTILQHARLKHYFYQMHLIST